MNAEMLTTTSGITYVIKPRNTMSPAADMQSLKACVAVPLSLQPQEAQSEQQTVTAALLENHYGQGYSLSSYTSRDQAYWTEMANLQGPARHSETREMARQEFGRSYGDAYMDLLDFDGNSRVGTTQQTEGRANVEDAVANSLKDVLSTGQLDGYVLTSAGQLDGQMRKLLSRHKAFMQLTQGVTSADKGTEQEKAVAIQNIQAIIDRDNEARAAEKPLAMSGNSAVDEVRRLYEYYAPNAPLDAEPQHRTAEQIYMMVSAPSRLVVRLKEQANVSAQPAQKEGKNGTYWTPHEAKWGRKGYGLNLPPKTQIPDYAAK